MSSIDLSFFTGPVAQNVNWAQDPPTGRVPDWPNMPCGVTGGVPDTSSWPEINMLTHPTYACNNTGTVDNRVNILAAIRDDFEKITIGAISGGDGNFLAGEAYTATGGKTGKILINASGAGTLYYVPDAPVDILANGDTITANSDSATTSSASARSESRLYFPAGTYLILHGSGNSYEVVVRRSYTELYGDGHNSIISIRTDGLTCPDIWLGIGCGVFYDGYPQHLTYETNDAAAVTTATEGSTTVTLSATAPAHWSVGDTILLEPSSIPSYINFPTNSHNTGGGGVGQIAKIAGIAGATVTLDRPLFVTLTGYGSWAARAREDVYRISMGVVSSGNSFFANASYSATGGKTGTVLVTTARGVLFYEPDTLSDIIEDGDVITSGGNTANAGSLSYTHSAITHVGLRDIQVQTDPGSVNTAPADTGVKGAAWTSLIRVRGASEVWLKGVRVYNASGHGISITYGHDCSIEDSDFDGIFVSRGGPNGHYYAVNLLGPGCNSILVVNNSFNDAGNKYLLTLNSYGCVFAYNYCINPTQASGATRAVLLHGEYSGWFLVEGNHCGGNNRYTIEADNWWGTQGLYNTIFRNRVEILNDPYVSKDPGITIEGWTTGARPAGVDVWHYANVIGNASPLFENHFTNGAVGDFDFRCTYLWMEKNTYYHHIWMQSQEPTSVLIDNLNTGANVPSWSSMPPSLYYTSRPSWWPVSKVWPCIGPDLDGIGTSSFISLPAQDRYDGTPPPEPPVLRAHPWEVHLKTNVAPQQMQALKLQRRM